MARPPKQRWLPKEARVRKAIQTGDAKDRRAAIRALVGILIEQPQRAVDAPSAFLARSGAKAGVEAERPKPLGFNELKRRYSTTDAEQRRKNQGSRAARKERPASGKAKPRGAAATVARVNNRQKPAAQAKKRAVSAPMLTGAAKKPRRHKGTGGRKPAQHRGASTAVTGMLFNALGEPTEAINGKRGAKCLIWENPDLSVLESEVRRQLGYLAPPTPAASVEEEARAAKKSTTALLNRLSGREVQGGETIGGQVLENLRTAMANDLQVTAVIACLNYGSRLTEDEREDFNWAFERAELGLLDSVVIREADRLARRLPIAVNLATDLQQAGLDLYFARKNRRIDLDSDEDQTAFFIDSFVADREARQFARKAREALDRRWAEEGRGWPGCQRYGFRRDERDFLEVDPEQWPDIELIHNSYGEWVESGATSCRKISKKLDELGVDLSPEKVRKILTDPIYVDGTFFVNRDGEQMSCEPIELERPISREVFQRNQELLACQKGKYSKTPIGTHAFNGLKVYHAACQGTVDPRTNKDVMLKAKFASNGEPTFMHRGKVPEGCRGYKIPQAEFEGAVIDKLLELARNEDLQKAWSAAALVDVIDGSDGDLEKSLEQQRKRLAEKVRNLDAEYERQMEKLVNGAGSEKGVSETQVRLVESIEEQLGTKRKQLKVLEENDSRRKAERKLAAGRSKEDLLSALEAILTKEVPEDKDHRVRRQAVLECCLSKIVVADVDDHVELELYGPLVPESALDDGGLLPVSPLNAARHLLEAELRDRESDAEAVATGGGSKRNTSTHVPTYKEVLHYRDRRETRARRRSQQELEDPWEGKYASRRSIKVAAWRSPRFSLKGVSIEQRRRYHQAIRLAAKSLKSGEVMTPERYEIWAANDISRPPLAALEAWAESQDLSVTACFRQLLPASKTKKPTSKPRGYWTDERCLEALDRAIAKFGRRSPESMRRCDYEADSYRDPDFPSSGQLGVTARRMGLSLSELMAQRQAVEQTSPNTGRARYAERENLWPDEACLRQLQAAMTDFTGEYGTALRPVDYERLYSTRKDFPSAISLQKLAQRRRTTLVALIDSLYGPCPPPKTVTHKSKARPHGYWTWERSRAALQEAVVSFREQHGRRMRVREYNFTFTDRQRFPSIDTLADVVRGQETTVSRLIAELDTEP